MNNLYINPKTTGCLLALLISTAACNDDTSGGSPVDQTLNTEILQGFSDNLAVGIYSDLSAKTASLYTDVQALADGEATQEELETCRTHWRTAREAWEQSEAFLFGPVSTENIDPRIDTWPVNYTDLEGQLSSGHEFTEAYVNNLEDALKGFHPIEYLIFGEDGNKTASELTERDLEYLSALSLNLKTLTARLIGQWNSSDNQSYYFEFTEAGNGSTAYSSQRAAFEELVNAMAGICEEVANGKMAEPFLQMDPSLEESPFSSNSVIDFTNNIRGVQGVYLGKYTIDGMGLEDLVRKNNLQLDSQVKNALSAAITSLNNITVPFGEAILSERIKVQNAMDAINELKSVLEDTLLPYVQQYTN